MKTISCVLMLLFLPVSFALAENAPRPFNVAPATVDLVKFPVLQDGELKNTKLVVELGLIPVELESPVVVLNHYRSDNSWRLQQLQQGDLVYKDQATGQFRYRADCSNRIEAVAPPCLSCHKVATVSPARGMMLPNERGGNKTSSPDGFGKAFDKAWEAVTSVIGGVLGGILPLILAAAILGLLWLVGREVVRSHRATPPPPATPPTPATPVAPVAYSRAPLSQPTTPVAAVAPPVTTPPVTPVAVPTTPSPTTPPARSINFTESSPDGKPFMIKTVGLRLVGYEEGEDGSTTIRIVRGK